MSVPGYWVRVAVFGKAGREDALNVSWPELECLRTDSNSTQLVPNRGNMSACPRKEAFAFLQMQKL